jgi:hypothetical protein
LRLSSHGGINDRLTVKRITIMTLKRRMWSRRKLTTFIAAGIAAIVLATGGYAIAGSGSSSGADPATVKKVVPFHRGQPTPARRYGRVPGNFSPGTGTIVTGTAANKAKAAPLAASPGGTVNRVVLLSDGEYNVYMIGVNWPHHIHARGQSRELLCDRCASPSSRSGRTCPGRTPWLSALGCREGRAPHLETALPPRRRGARRGAGRMTASTAGPDCAGSARAFAE